MSILQSKLSGITNQFLKDMDGIPDTPAGLAKLRDCLRDFTVQARRLQFVSTEQDQITARDVYLAMPDMREAMPARIVAPAMDSEHHEVWDVMIMPEFVNRIVVDSPRRIPLGSTIWHTDGLAGRVILEIDRVWGPQDNKEYYLCACEDVDG
jgi:hypothetical protein